MGGTWRSPSRRPPRWTPRVAPPARPRPRATARTRSWDDLRSRHVADYLREVVLGPLTEDVRGFLAETSVLRRLTAALCDEVTGRDDSADVLRELDRQNLFVVLSDNGASSEGGPPDGPGARGTDAHQEAPHVQGADAQRRLHDP